MFPDSFSRLRNPDVRRATASELISTFDCAQEQKVTKKSDQVFCSNIYGVQNMINAKAWQKLGEHPSSKSIKGRDAHFKTFQFKNLKANMQLRYLIFAFGFAFGGHVRPLNIPPITLDHSAEQETFRKSSWILFSQILLQRKWILISSFMAKNQKIMNYRSVTLAWNASYQSLVALKH